MLIILGSVCSSDDWIYHVPHATVHAELREASLLGRPQPLGGRGACCSAASFRQAAATCDRQPAHDNLPATAATTSRPATFGTKRSVGGPPINTTSMFNSTSTPQRNTAQRNTTPERRSPPAQLSSETLICDGRGGRVERYRREREKLLRVVSMRVAGRFPSS